MNDGDKLRAIAEYLDTIPGGGEMQADLRRIAVSVDRPEPVEWLVLDCRSVRLPDVEWVAVHEPTGDKSLSVAVSLGLVSGRTVDVRVQPDEVDELLAVIHRSRS